MRALGGQLLKPPETAISVPEQEAIANLETGGGVMAPLGGQRRTREQLGLPPRQSYFPGMPTLEEAQQTGVLPPIRAAKESKGEKRRVRKGKELA